MSDKALMQKIWQATSKSGVISDALAYREGYFFALKLLEQECADRLAAEARIRLLERDRLRFSAALYDAFQQFDRVGDPRWDDIAVDHGSGTTDIEWDDAPAPKEEGEG